MNTSQWLVSTAAALAVVGAAGLAIAQTTTPEPLTTTPNAVQSDTATPPPVTGTGSTATTSPDASTTMATEPDARADRN